MFYKYDLGVQEEIDFIKIESVWLPILLLDQKAWYCVCIIFLKN